MTIAAKKHLRAALLDKFNSVSMPVVLPTHCCCIIYSHRCIEHFSTDINTNSTILIQLTLITFLAPLPSPHPAPPFVKSNDRQHSLPYRTCRDSLPFPSLPRRPSVTSSSRRHTTCVWHPRMAHSCDAGQATGGDGALCTARMPRSFFVR